MAENQFIEHNLADTIRGDTFAGAKMILEVNGTPIDLSGVRIDCHFKEGGVNGKTSLRLGTAYGPSSISKSESIAGLFELGKFKANMTPGEHYYDIQFTFPDNTVRTYISGTINIIQDVTK